MQAGDHFYLLPPFFKTKIIKVIQNLQELENQSKIEVKRHNEL